MLKQLSIFAENIKGKMQKVTGILLEEDINILGSVTNDSAEYGIIRMVVSKPEQALEALTKAGFICKLSDVLGIEVKDEVGNLNKLLLSLQESNIFWRISWTAISILIICICLSTVLPDFRSWFSTYRISVRWRHV